jgi:hypothetical protein
MLIFSSPACLVMSWLSIPAWYSSFSHGQPVRWCHGSLARGSPALNLSQILMSLLPCLAQPRLSVARNPLLAVYNYTVKSYSLLQTKLADDITLKPRPILGFHSSPVQPRLWYPSSQI